MDPNLTTLERAFQLAATGRYLTVSEIKLRLHEEGYSHGQIDGPLLKKQLMDAIANARHERGKKSKIGKA